MKKPSAGVFLIATVIVFALSALTACNSDLLVPKNVTIDGTTYRNGFYGELWPNNFTLKSDVIKVGINEFHRVDCEKFDWVHSYIGSKSEGIIYCAEDQWEQVSEFYSSNDNFVYYCRIGAEYVDRDPIIVTIPDIDPSKFDELMGFADKNCYNPFGSNADVKTRRLPIPDRDKSPKLIFYKESKDGFFASYQGYIFHALDGKLLLLFYYDYGHGKYEEMVAVDVPDDLGQYFINLLD
jgi:hypothetical protein